MTGDPARDIEPTPHHWGGPDEPIEDEYAQHQREQREAEQKARMDAAHEQAKAERCQYCALGKEHPWDEDADA